MHSELTTVPRGGVIGILGGGHMGRMTALAARRLGFRTRVLELDPTCTAEGIAERSVVAAPHDLRAALDVVAGCDVVTVSSEDVAAEVLESAALRAPLRPAHAVLALAQDRARERRWLDEAGLNLLPWRPAAGRDELVAAFETLGAPCIVKPQRRRRAELRPLRVTSVDEAARAWIAMRGLPTVVEAAGAIESELSALVARTPAGEVAAYAPSLGVRERGRLVGTALPGRMPARRAARTRELAAYVARRLGVEGLLAVEFFLLADGRLVVNELVPCPHPTYHATELACATDQFEQLVRCVTGLSLGATTVVSPAATLAVASTLPRVTGHLCTIGRSVEEAVARMRRAASALSPESARWLSRLETGLAAEGRS